jgi:hypothetical protein
MSLIGVTVLFAAPRPFAPRDQRRGGGAGHPVPDRRLRLRRVVRAPLFAQLGGGIYTKAPTSARPGRQGRGRDPEDDPRNPA